MSIKELSEHTPITTALAITLFYIAFWLGGEIASLRTKVEATQATQQKLTDIVSQLTNIAGENKLRLNHLERTVDKP